MRLLILGGDGYLVWPTALRFSARIDSVKRKCKKSKRSRVQRASARR